MQAQVLCDFYLNLLPTLKQDVCIHLAAADDGLAVESRAYKTGRRCGQGPKKAAEPQGTQEHSSSRFEGIYKTPLYSPYVILQT